MVVPRRPAGTDALSETALAALVTRDGMVGTASV
jgi:nitrile hydratase